MKDFIAFEAHAAKSEGATKCMENRNMVNEVAAPDSYTCAAETQTKIHEIIQDRSIWISSPARILKDKEHCSISNDSKDVLSAGMSFWEIKRSDYGD